METMKGKTQDYICISARRRCQVELELSLLFACWVGSCLVRDTVNQILMGRMQYQTYLVIPTSDTDVGVIMLGRTR